MLSLSPAAAPENDAKTVNCSDTSTQSEVCPTLWSFLTESVTERRVFNKQM